jgi:hypothetical protein
MYFYNLRNIFKDYLLKSLNKKKDNYINNVIFENYIMKYIINKKIFNYY